MLREKEIEEMARVMANGRFIEPDRNQIFLFAGEAETLYNAGYRKQSEVVDEFVKRLKETPIKLSIPLFGLSTKDEIEAHFDDIMLEVGGAIDRIAEEMKGGIERIENETQSNKN